GVGAEVRLKAPDRNDDLARHAELPFDAVESGFVLREPLTGALHERAADATGIELLEAELEGVLTAVEADDGPIVGHARERSVDRALRDTLAGSLQSHGGEPAIEAFGAVAAGLRADRARSGEETCEQETAGGDRPQNRAPIPHAAITPWVSAEEVYAPTAPCSSQAESMENSVPDAMGRPIRRPAVERTRRRCCRRPRRAATWRRSHCHRPSPWRQRCRSGAAPPSGHY